jgi:crossover junction endodeoxyribonuclease RuvC
MIKEQENYKILGIDPGTNILGYAILEVKGRELKLVTYGVIKLKGDLLHHEKLREIFLDLQELIETYLPKYLAVEAPFYGKNVQSMLKLGRAQGVAMAAAITMGLEISEYSPKKIKQSVTGNGNASKEQVAAMLQTILRVKISMENLDATDALAVAVTHYNQNSGALSGKTKFNSWSSFIKANPEKLRK